VNYKKGDGGVKPVRALFLLITALFLAILSPTAAAGWQDSLDPTQSFSGFVRFAAMTIWFFGFCYAPGRVICLGIVLRRGVRA
jgi:hypothetical protein